jgi:two-component SAPR family response regulator
MTQATQSKEGLKLVIVTSQKRLVYIVKGRFLARKSYWLMDETKRIRKLSGQSRYRDNCLNHKIRCVCQKITPTL